MGYLDSLRPLITVLRKANNPCLRLSDLYPICRAPGRSGSFLLNKWGTKRRTLNWIDSHCWRSCARDPGRSAPLKTFLPQRGRFVLQETGTTTWYAVRFDSSLYGIFDTFPDQEGRDAHLNGEIAKLLFARAENYSQSHQLFRCSTFLPRNLS